MCPKLRDHQLKIINENIMVTTNQKPVTDTHTKKRKESKHNTTDSHQITREESKRKEKEQEINRKTTRKQLTK